jgi:hypothetical protein
LPAISGIYIINKVANAIGGLSVGEPAEEMYAMTRSSAGRQTSLFDGCGNSNKYFGKHSFGS